MSAKLFGLTETKILAIYFILIIQLILMDRLARLIS
jgi:hypothetical protein